MNESRINELSGITIEEVPGSNVLEAQLSGKLTEADYEHFAPAVERAVQAHGKVRLLVQMHDFHGWTAGALWEDLKFDVKHFRDLERVAMVGETKWQQGMAVFCKPFTAAKIRYFEHQDLEQARAWLES